MPLFTSEQLNRWTLQAEEQFVKEFNCIVDRVALDITDGTALYVLSDEIINIRRVTYKGVKIDPISQRDEREYVNTGVDSKGKPTLYAFNNLGQMTIKLIPTPNETITVTQTDLFKPSVIREQCIVEYYAMANGVEYKIPDYFRRRLLKAYVLKLAFLAEGKGQNIKAAKYWDAKWKSVKELYGESLYDFIVTPRRLISSGGIARTKLVGPVLPADKFGIGVDTGY